MKLCGLSASIHQQNHSLICLGKKNANTNLMFSTGWRRPYQPKKTTTKEPVKMLQEIMWRSTLLSAVLDDLEMT